MTPLSKLVTRDQFGLWLEANGVKGTGVEVGTYYGAWAEIVTRQWAGMLFTVDPYNWDKTPEYVDGCRVNWTAPGRPELDPEAVRQAAQLTLKGRENVEMLHMTSLNAASRFPDGSLAWVFIDGNHAPEAFAADVSVWWPKVRPGGIFAGHDFYNRDDELMRGGVFDILWDWAIARGLKPHVTQCTSWWFIKP